MIKNIFYDNGKLNKNKLRESWIIKNNNDTIGGHFITHNLFKDKYIYKDTIEVQFYYPEPLMSKNSELYLVYAKDGKFNHTFSNINSLNLDTLPNVYRINEMEDNNLSQYKRVVYQNYIFESPGTKYIRNIFLERFDTIRNNIESKSFIDIYFEKKIQVIDTTN